MGLPEAAGEGDAPLLRASRFAISHEGEGRLADALLLLVPPAGRGGLRTGLCKFACAANWCLCASACSCMATLCAAVVGIGALVLDVGCELR